MRTFFLLVLALGIGVGAYAYAYKPDSCRKLGNDLEATLVTVFTTSPGPAVASAPAPASAVPTRTPPAVIPAEPNWTWATNDKVYRDVRILRIDPDYVTIVYSGGGGQVPIASLPADIKKQLNHDPGASNGGAADAAASAPAGGGDLAGGTTDYAAALAASRTSGKWVLLDFTGSDWCPYCQDLDSEVISTSAFARFVGANYIFVTLDFPRNLPLPDDLKRQNDALAQKFNINGYPTLLVIDADEREVGRTSGYAPGSGPDAVMAQLRSFRH